MATRTQARLLPYGIGQFGHGWLIALVLLLVIAAVGVYGYSLQLREGEIVTGLRNTGTMGGATWGLYVAFVVYFVGVSFAGITVAALIRLLHLEHLQPISRMAQVLTVVSLILAALSVLADVGQPLRALINLPRYARPMSPFFGTFTLVISGYLFASLVYLYLDGRRDAALLAQRETRLRWLYRLWAAGYRDTPAEQQRHAQASFWLAIAIIPLLIMANSTSGFVFGIQAGRPGWFSALQAPAFVILAGVSGVGHLIVLAAIIRYALGEQERFGLAIFRWLGNFLLVLTAIYLYFTVVDWLTAIYAAPHREARVAASVLTGEYAWIYWLSVASLTIPFVLLLVQFVIQRYNTAVLILCGALVNVAAVGKRFLIVVPSQTYGALLPYQVGAYQPTWVEYSVVIGLMALGAVLIILFMKVFPIMAVTEE
jgi:Ni/Fe-hydrogenase subunit HybB-like protein